MLGLALSLLVAALFGALIDAFLRGDGPAHPLERAGRALTFGLAGLGLLGMAADTLGLGVSRVSVGALAVVAAGGLLVGCRRRPARLSGEASPPADVGAYPPSAAPGWRALSPGARAAAAGLLLLAAAALAIQVRSGLIRPTYQFDAITRWMFKAKVLAFDGTLVGPVTYDAAFGFTHQRYPPLVPHMANLPALLTGGFDDRVASALFPWFAVALCCLAAGVLARRVGLLGGALAAAWIANLPLLAFIDNPPPGAGSWSAMADLPLALFVTAAGFALLDLLDGRRPRAAAELGLLLAFALLTKNEGLPLVGGVALALLLTLRAGRWRRTVWVCGSALLVFVLLWGLRIPGIPALDEDYHGQVGVAALVAGFERLPLILWGGELNLAPPGRPPQPYPTPGLLPELVSFRSWNLTWPLAALLLALGGRRGLARGGRALLLIVVVQVAAYVAAYMVTAWESPNARALVGPDGDPLAFLLNLTLGRLLLHVAPLAVCAGLLAAPLRASRSG